MTKDLINGIGIVLLFLIVMVTPIVIGIKEKKETIGEVGKGRSKYYVSEFCSSDLEQDRIVIKDRKGNVIIINHPDSIFIYKNN